MRTSTAPQKLRRNFEQEARAFAVWLHSTYAHRKLKWASAEKLSGLCPRPEHPEKHPSFGLDVAKKAWACSCGSGKLSDLMREFGWADRPAEEAQIPEPEILPPPPPADTPPDDVYEYENGNRKLKWRVKGKKSRVVWRHESGVYGIQGEPG